MHRSTRILLATIVAGAACGLVWLALANTTRPAEEIAPPLSGQAGRPAHDVAAAPAAQSPYPYSIPLPSAALQDAPLPLPDKPTSHPALLRFIDKSAANRLPVDFPAKIPVLFHEQDVAWVLHVLRDSTDLDAIRNEAANLLRRSKVENLESHFIAVLRNPAEKERFTSYAIQHLGDMMTEYRDGTGDDSLGRAEVIRKQLRAALTDPRVMVRNEALLALTRERDPMAVAIIREGLSGPTGDQAQDLLIRCAKEADLTDLIPAIRPLAYSDDQVVRIAAMNVLAQWKDVASRPAFEEASLSTVPRIQRAGNLALRLMDPATD